MVNNTDVINTVQTLYETYLRCKSQPTEQEYTYIPASGKEVNKYGKRESNRTN